MISAELQAKHKEIIESLKGWQKMLRKYQEPDTKKAVIQIINTFTPYLAIWVLMYFALDYSILLTIALGIVNGFMTARLFIIQHDCGHHSFLKSRKWNDRVGFICSFFSTLPYKYWAKVHNHHHGHTGQYEERSIGDIDFMTVDEFKNASTGKRIGYMLFRHPLSILVVIPIVYFTVNNRFPMMLNVKGWKKTTISQFVNNLSILGLYVFLTWLLGWNFIIVQLIILYSFAISAIWFFYVQHQHEHTYMHQKENWNFVLSAIKGSSYYKLPKVMQWLTGNIGFHHIHHLNSRIPNYNLEKCFKENPVLNKYVNVLTIRSSFKCLFANLWDEENQCMISFREFRRREKMQLV